MQRPKISFVVPVRNDAERLQLSLQAIRESDFDPSGIEILVPDNGSTDRSVEVARSAGARVIELPGQTVAALRNRATAEAKGDIVAFCDSDNIIAPGWAGIACELLQAPEVGAVGSMYSPPDPPTWVQRSYDGLRDHNPGVRPTRWLGAGNLAVKRELFNDLGGFDETLVTCEDVDLCKRILRANRTLLNDPRLESIHLGDPKTLRELFLGELWRGRDNLRVSVRRPVAVRDLPSILIPLVFLLSFSAILFGLVTIAPWGQILSGTGLLAIGSLTFLRAVLMIRRSSTMGWRNLPQTLVVALTFDLARALALVVPIPHHRQAKRG